MNIVLHSTALPTLLLPFLLAAVVLFCIAHLLAIYTSNSLSPRHPSSTTHSAPRSASAHPVRTPSSSKRAAHNRKSRRNTSSSKMGALATGSAPSNTSPLDPPSSPTTTSSVSSDTSSSAQSSDTRIRQTYDAFLVVDFEATCVPGGGFDYPNEIIEFPIVLLEWADMDNPAPDIDPNNTSVTTPADRIERAFDFDGHTTTNSNSNSNSTNNNSNNNRRANRLAKVAEFRSFVRPTWRAQLSTFCTALTGVKQSDVDTAPTFPQALALFEAFLETHGLIDAHTRERTAKKFVFCSDGPFDVRDFVAKQCYISKIAVPWYFQSDVLDVRKAVASYTQAEAANGASTAGANQRISSTAACAPSKKKYSSKYMNISAQLRAMGLEEFQGRQHCGIDDARNVSRILIALARAPLRLESNTFIHPNRRWWWMVKDGSGRVDFPEEYQEPYASYDHDLGTTSTASSACAVADAGAMASLGAGAAAIASSCASREEQALGSPPAYSYAGLSSPPSYYSPPLAMHVTLSAPLSISSIPFHQHSQPYSHSRHLSLKSMPSRESLRSDRRERANSASPSFSAPGTASVVGSGTASSSSSPVPPYASVNPLPVSISAGGHMQMTMNNSASGMLGLWMPSASSKVVTITSPKSRAIPIVSPKTREIVDVGATTGAGLGVQMGVGMETFVT